MLLILTVTAAACGIISLIPYRNASYASLLGYKSFCTFNPASALYCFFIAGSSCFIRSTFFKWEQGTIKEKIRNHILSLIPLAVIFLLAFGSTLWFINVDSQYDDISEATVTMKY